jgi:hypothetical protein
MLSEVNPHDSRVLQSEATALLLMLEKREKYISQGRNREAHGLGTGIWILWKSLILESAGSTGFGGI